jgi:hypothetical protein
MYVVMDMTCLARRPGVLAFYLAMAIATFTPRSSSAGPEIGLRELGTSQIKKGVRAIGMGGDGATQGNYGLIGREASTAVLDYGLVHFTDTGNSMTFAAAGFTSPPIWHDAAIFVLAAAQRGADLHVWTRTSPSASKPPSTGSGSNDGLFLKLAKPITASLSVGVLLSYEQSEMTLVRDDGRGVIQLATAWRPSGGAAIAWRPAQPLLIGARLMLNHDQERRIDSGSAAREGLARSYEYRAGASWEIHPRLLLDAGLVVLSRANALEGTATVSWRGTVGAELALVSRRVWLRGGYDESFATSGLALRVGATKIDVAFLHDFGIERTQGAFGERNAGVFATLTLDYERALSAPR